MSTKNLIIHAIDCKVHSAGVDSEVLESLSAAVLAAADVGKASAPFLGPVADAISAALSAAGSLIGAVVDLAIAIDRAGDEPDQLYLSLSNDERVKKVWPQNRTYSEIRSGQIVRPNLIRTFFNAVDINFWEYDTGSDDDYLGRLTVDESHAGGVRYQVVARPEEGAIYVVVYSVEDISIQSISAALLWYKHNGWQDGTQNADNAQASVTLYFTQQDFDNFNTYVTANNLNIPLLPAGGTDNGNGRIIQYHGSYTGSPIPGNYNGSPIVINAELVWDNANNWWVVTIPVTGFSGFYLTTGNFALPLTLLEFKGGLQENAVNLQWVTSDEVNTKEFVIERRNQNTTFTAIGKVFAQSTAGTHQYSFTDTKPLAGKNFYRLKLIDKDGNFTYSNIVPIKINDAVFTLSAYPNPVKNILNIKTSSTGNNKITMHVTDLTGKLLLNKVINTGNGESIIPLNVSKLTAGTYFLKILSVDGKENIVKKFVKQ